MSVTVSASMARLCPKGVTEEMTDVEHFFSY